MMFPLVLSLCLGIDPSVDSISSDDLDHYAAKVVKARKDCGPVAVWYCLRRLGQAVPPEDVMRRADLREDGTSLRSLLQLASSFGHEAQALEVDCDSLESLPVPTILVIGRRHCVVYEGLEPDGGRVRLFEPSVCKLKTVERSHLCRSWTGEVIVFDSPPMSVPGFVSWVGLVALGVLGLVALVKQPFRRFSSR